MKRISLILTSSIIALIVFLIFWLEVSPYQLRNTIESAPNYPKSTYIITKKFDSEIFDRDEKDFLLAEQELNELLLSGELAMQSGVIVYKREAPKIYASASMINLKLFELHQGTPVAGQFLAQVDSIYNIGDKVDAISVSGIISFLSTAYFMKDSVAVKVIEDLSEIPRQMQRGVTFYFRTTDEAELARVQDLINNYVGYKTESLPFYESIAQDTFALDSSQVQVQKYAAIFLLICLFTTLFSVLASQWQKNREPYRIERMLGRSRNYFFHHWFKDSLQYWLWGSLVATLIFLTITTFQGYIFERYLLVLSYFFIILLSGLLLTFLVASSASRFPLARNTADSKRTWRNNLSPIIITLVLIFGVTYLFAHSLSLWNESSRSLRQIGANTVLVETVSSAVENLPQNLCSSITVECVPYGLANIHLWNEALISLEENVDYAKMFKLDVDDATELRISLVEGRFPHEGKREVAINERALADIRSVDPNFGIGTVINLDYEVVGIVKTPPLAEFAIFDSIYEATFFVAPEPPQITPDNFLAPWGKEGLVLQLTNGDSLSEIKKEIRDIYRDVEFIQPAKYARQFSLTVQRSLIHLAFLFILSFGLAIVAYHNLIVTLLIQRTLEISVWRLLGMNITKLKRYLAKEVFFLPLITGIFATLLGCALLLWREQREVIPYAFICGIVLTFLLSFLCIVLIQQKAGAFAKEEVNETYRKAL